MTDSKLDRRSFAGAARAGQTVWVAGVYDALSAKLAEEAGFRAVMTSGFAVSASLLGQPDVEIYTMTENLSIVRNVVNAVNVPVVADTDTGYGNAVNVMRTVREFEQAGVAAMILEDQEVPKRCPAAAARIEILPRAESVAKIRAAVAARRDPDMLIVARTDAVDEHEAIERAKAYAEAGADIIQPISRTFHSIDGLRRMRQACGRPLSLQILGWLETELRPEQIAEVAGLATFPLVGLLTVTAALRSNLAALANTHTTAKLPLEAATMGEFKKFIGFEEIEALQARFMVAPER
ncbi:MAG: isocitrate lyase/PEP mutase family protein [Gammaproteobacteria bacterium]|nr:isocitrate lyase/PEP mutase family protein [Gammaproteobacteria bacterium]